MTYLKGAGAFIVLSILMSVNGFLQSFSWPNLLTLVHSVATPEKDGVLLGFWVTSSNIGNIIGFVICQIFVFNQDLPWQTSMFIASGFMLLMGILLAFRVKDG